MCDVKPGVHEQRLATGLGMGPHDRVLDGLEGGEGLAFPLALLEALEQRAELGLPVVHRGERVEVGRAATRSAPSYAACWSENSVSPPAGGMTTALRIEPSGGRSTKVTSVCHAMPRARLLMSP